MVLNGLFLLFNLIKTSNFSHRNGKKPNFSTAQIPMTLPFKLLACFTFIYADNIAKVVVAKAQLNNTIFVFIDFSIPLTTPQLLS
jgi:hypothetical protein